MGPFSTVIFLFLLPGNQPHQVSSAMFKYNPSTQYTFITSRSRMMKSAHIKETKLTKETKQYELEFFEWQNKGQNQRLFMAGKPLPPFCGKTHLLAACELRQY